MGLNVNETLFPVILSLANKCGVQVSKERDRIFIDSDTYETIEKRKLSLLSQFHPAPNCFFALYQEEDILYLIESGLPELNNDIEKRLNYKGLDNVALYLLFLVETKISPRIEISPLDIVNEVFPNDTQRNEIDFTIVEKFFPIVYIYRIPEPASIISNKDKEYYLKKIVLSYICASYNEVLSHPIRFANDVLVLYNNLAVSEGEYLPIDCLIQSVLAYRWNFVFLDLYRCIERLYVIGWVHDFAGTFDSKKTDGELYEVMSTKRIEYHEGNILDHLFSLIDASILSELAPLLRNRNASQYIYDIRNKVVHYQTSDVSYNETDWNRIIIFLLKVIDRLYQLLEEEIKTIGNKTRSR